ncbi:hypothetical protein HXX76_010979 [Chlamydomonas incerta]|uniref:Disease resistance R13L4/SHOC-2-like LRR domain-containing protein n=1 Tax=Chlamydomonas incerta TaxID=51695 RepID=A0A835VXI5_CHLIN|nr:hypothetical protein HXX76_010979 [Chlamydomonas incerta]|eukprot:KAG2429209.1 hypothetical protein HXX76_010979 [Chlamydomonas incerta]
MDQADLNQTLETGELNLSARQLQGIPDLVFTCCSLQVLNLSANSIGSLPSTLAQLRSLTDLDLSFNQLRELPECLGALTGLVSLRAQYNQIERVHPGAVSRLGDCLEELVLADNSLICLPPELGCLSRLRRLDLRFNSRLTALPPQLGRLAGSLVQLGVEGCPLGEADPAETAGKPQAPGSRPASATPARKQLQHFYRVLQQVAAQAEAEVQVTGVTAPGAAGGRACHALQAVLQQLQRVGELTEQRPASTAAARSHAPEGAAGAKPANGSSGTAQLLGGGAHLDMAAAQDKHQGTRAKDVACSKLAAESESRGPGSKRVEVLTLGNTAVDSHDPAVSRSGSGSGRMARPGHLQPLSTHLGPGVARAAAAAAPRSPLTDLRNSHADLELSYDDDDEEGGGQVAGPGINIVGDGAGAVPPLSPGPLSPGMSGAAGDGTSSAMSRALEELADLPPAAAAAMYRSLDMVAAGVQEMREGRPLSRGGTAAARGLPVAMSRPSNSSQAHRRPGSSSLRPGSSMGRYGEPHRPGTASYGGRANTAPGSGQAVASSQPLTGAMALLASAGMGPEYRSAGVGSYGSGTGDARRPASSDAAGSSAAAAGGDGGGSALGGMAPITFPLASGVRGMLRNSSRGSSRGAQEGGLTGAAPAGEAIPGARPAGLPPGPSVAAAAKPMAQGQGSRALIGKIDAGCGDSAVGGDDKAGAGGGDAALGVALDQLDVVRRLLAARNPCLLEALDHEVFLEGEDGAGQEQDEEVTQAA